MKSGCCVCLQIVPRYCIKLCVTLNEMGCMCWDIKLHKQLHRFHYFSQDFFTHAASAVQELEQAVVK